MSTLVYAGSVKNLYEAEDAQQLWFEYTDDYSVFDWGKMPDTIPGKGQALAELAEFFFATLADPEAWRGRGLADDPGVAPWLPLRHHFLRREANRILVHRVNVPDLPTAAVGGTLVYDYSYALQPRQLIPLEVIFRFGVPAGSSLLERADWYPFDIKVGAEFPEPLIEFSTKLETKDRVLTYQEAAMVLKGDTERLAELHARTRAIALFLKRLFAERGLKLWDGKLEWALFDEGLALVDSIGPDELRVSQDGAVMSKQFLRDFYLGSPWHQAISRAHKMARQRGTENWKSIVDVELREQPPPLTKPYLAAAEALYADFRDILVHNQHRSRFLERVRALE